MLASSQRPMIHLVDGVVMHNGNKARVVFTENYISVGCTDISVEAARHILEAHKIAFPEHPKKVVFQEGKHNLV